MKTVQTLDGNEIQLMLDRLRTCRDDKKLQMTAARNVCMFLLMLDAGLRVGELVQLLQGDLWMERDCVTTLTIRAEIAKRKHERQIPLTPRARESVRTLNKLVWPRSTDWQEHYAFYNYEPHDSLTTRQVQRLIKAAGYDALQRRVTPHMLRHTFATRVLAASNIRVAQQLLGHASIQTTQIYTHPNSLDHRNAIAVISGAQLDSNPQET